MNKSFSDCIHTINARYHVTINIKIFHYCHNYSLNLTFLKCEVM